MSRQCDCCQGCEDRHVGCHATCERYIDWSDRHQKYLETVRKARKEETEVGAYYGNKFKVKKKPNARRTKIQRRK